MFDAALATPDGRVARLTGRATMVFAIVCLLAAVALAVAQVVWQMHMLVKPLRITAADAERLGRAAVPLAVALAAFGAFGLAALSPKRPAWFPLLRAFRSTVRERGHGRD
jgi:hypothetical protein